MRKPRTPLSTLLLLVVATGAIARPAWSTLPPPFGRYRLLLAKEQRRANTATVTLEFENQSPEWGGGSVWVELPNEVTVTRMQPIACASCKVTQAMARLILETGRIDPAKRVAVEVELVNESRSDIVVCAQGWSQAAREETIVDNQVAILVPGKK